MSKNEKEFNLLDEPWIRVATPGGGERDVGLLELFTEAPRLGEIVDPSPLVKIALYRPLLAILYQTHKIEDTDDWVRIWKEWDLKGIAGYLEQFRDRFDLFSRTNPFYQHPSLGAKPGKPPTGNRAPAGENSPGMSVVKLAHEISVDGNTPLFNHPPGDDFSIDAATAARWLICGMNWGYPGTGGYPNFSAAPLLGRLSSLLIGRNLRESLVLNLVQKQDLLEKKNRPFYKRDEEDTAVWERSYGDVPPTSFYSRTKADIATRPPSGIADYLTWPCRYARLLLRPDGRISRVLWVEGERLPGGGEDDTTSGTQMQYIDPFHSCQIDKAKGAIPLNLTPGKAAWRDADALFSTFVESTQKDSCSALSNLRLVREQLDGAVQRRLPIFVGGAAPRKQPPPDIWLAETFHFPPSLVSSQALLARLKEALLLSEAVKESIRNSLYHYAMVFLSHANGGADKQAVGKFRDSLFRESDYWSALERPFHNYLAGLEDDSSEREWREAIRRAARAAFESSLSSQDSTGRHLRALTAAENHLRYDRKGLNSLFPREESNV